MGTVSVVYAIKMTNTRVKQHRAGDRIWGHGFRAMVSWPVASSYTVSAHTMVGACGGEICSAGVEKRRANPAKGLA